MTLDSYASLWMACASSGILVPVPEDLPLVWAGIRVADGEWSAALTVLAALLGVGARDIIAWLAGRALGAVLLDGTRANGWIGRRNVEWARRVVDRHGAFAVFLGRFFVGFRAPVFAVAGAMGVPFRSFLLYDGVGLLLAVPLTLSLGWAFGHPVLTFVLAAVSWGRTWIAPIGVAAALAVTAAWQWRRMAVRRHAAEKAG